MCATPPAIVGAHHSLCLNFLRYSLYLGLVPEASAPGVWQNISGYMRPNQSSYGDYGAFAVQFALSDFPLWRGNVDVGLGSSGRVEASGGGDDGQNVLNFLTKCDQDSWCGEFAQFNATMTGEGFSNGDGTRSHPWGTSAIPATVQGVVGVQRLEPGYAAFAVKPRLAPGALSNVSLRLPTLAGFIEVNASRRVASAALLNKQRAHVLGSGFDVSVAVPCNTVATLCVPLRDAQHNQTSLLLDGDPVPAVVEGRHLCAQQSIGCGINGAHRHVSTL